MDIAKIIEYQKTDAELFKIEKTMRENPNRKTANEMQKRASDAQKRSVELEDKAKVLNDQIATIKKQFEAQNKMLSQVINKDVDNLDSTDVDKIFELKEKLAQNSNFLDKNLTRLAENVKMVIDEYQKATKVYQDARVKYNESKTAYDKSITEIEPKKKELESKLATAENGISKETLDKYKRLRADNIFPVFVPLRGNSCGGCNMELPIAQVSKLKENGTLQCEHCHRIIYYI